MPESLPEILGSRLIWPRGDCRVNVVVPVLIDLPGQAVEAHRAARSGDKVRNFSEWLTVAKKAVLVPVNSK